MKSWQDQKDTLSRLIKRATDILFMQSPIATSLGVMCGFFMDFIATAFSPLWENSKIINLSNVSIYSYVFSGIFICNVISLVFSLFHRRELAPEIEDAFAFIQYTKKKGSLPEYQIRLMYINLAEKVLQAATNRNPPDDSPKKKSPVRRIKPSPD